VNETRNGDIHPGRPIPPAELPEQGARGRIFVAAAQLAHDLGPARVGAEAICGLSGESEKTFSGLFGSAGECLREAVLEAREWLLRPVREPSEELGWQLGVEAAIAGFYRSVAERPRMAELLLTHSYAIERGYPQDTIEGATEDLRRLIEPGRRAGARAGLSEPPPMIDEFLAGGALWSARFHLGRGASSRLAPKATEVAHLIGVSYLKAPGAARILGLDGRTTGP
jgi:hypothetical protein